MSTFIYRCPATGASVTGWQSDSPATWAGPQLLYVGERCPACGGLHIVNPATGRMLSEESAESLRQIKAPTEAVAIHG